MDGVEHTIWLNVEHGIFASQTFNCGLKEAAQSYPAMQPELFAGNIVAY